MGENGDFYDSAQQANHRTSNRTKYQSIVLFPS